MSAMKRAPSAGGAVRRVVIVAYDGVQPLDVVGPHEVFNGANVVLDAADSPESRYRLEIVAPSSGAVRSESGLQLLAAAPLPDPAGPFDTIVVPGGNAAPVLAAEGGELVRWLAAAAPNSRRVTAVCSGTFLVAAAGLAAGRRVTTHWARAGQLAAAYPALDVEPDAIYITDGPLWTSAGVTAGIDLALALVDADVGPSVAQTVARHMVVHVRRPGGQTQYAAPVWSEPATSGPIAVARDLIHADMTGDLSVGALAAACGMSERHFARQFRHEIGESPARYVDRVRVEAARAQLETTDLGLAAVADRCGFGTTETLRRAFHRRLGCSPDDYRRRMAPAS